MKTIAVIGAGVTGVTTAFVLRELGYKVTVFEKKEENLDMLRGLLNRLSTKNFDVQKYKIKTYIE